MNRKKLVLFILLIVFALAVAWSYYARPRQKTVDSLKFAPGRTQQAAVKRPEAPVQAAVRPAPVAAAPVDDRFVRLDLLEQNQSGFKGYLRNIFKPIFIDEIKAMMRKAAAPKPLPVPPVAVSQPKVEAPPPVAASPGGQPETVQAALARFVFLGYLKKGNRKTIFLSKDKDIILVRKGDRFAGKYEAKSLTDQALTIVATDTGEEIVVSLVENQPLAAAAAK